VAMPSKEGIVGLTIHDVVLLPIDLATSFFNEIKTARTARRGLRSFAH